MTPQILDLVPLDAVMPAGPQTLLITVSVLLFVLALWFVFVEIKRRSDWVPLYAFIGGHLAVTLPASTAVFTTSNPFWLWFGATITIALSIGIAWVMSMVYCTDGKHQVTAQNISGRFAAAGK
jgi:hypothetical protein